MAKKKTPSTNAVPFSDAPVMTDAEQKAQYKRDYEFNKNTPARSSVDGYTHRHVMKGDSYYMPNKEINLIKGTAHQFKGARTSGTKSYVRTRKSK